MDVGDTGRLKGILMHVQIFLIPDMDRNFGLCEISDSVLIPS